MWPVEFHDAAEEELTAAIDWYAGQNASAAVSFAGEIRDAVLSITSDPTRLPTLGPERRFCLLKRFPYLLVFRVLGDRVQILAVAHAARRPGYWKHRH
jgi:plasmid stabilization system protein ParE